MTLPDFMIIGAMKCATSSLYEQLALQPGIMLSSPKEPNFFSNDEIFEHGIDWYKSLFGMPEHMNLVGEASTHYTKLPTYPHAVERIMRYVPDTKFIYVMRHPVDRLVSQYVHEWSQKVIQCDINKALQSYPELLDYSRYDYQLTPYLDAFGSDRVLPVFFERMLAFPQLELKRVCAFIGYQGTPKWHEIAPQNVSKERVRRFAGYELLVENPAMQWLRRAFIPRSFRNAVKSSLSMRQRPILDTEDITMLERVFDEDLAMLGEKLDTHLSCKNFKEIVKSDVLDWKR